MILFPMKKNSSLFLVKKLRAIFFSKIKIQCRQNKESNFRVKFSSNNFSFFLDLSFHTSLSLFLSLSLPLSLRLSRSSQNLSISLFLFQHLFLFILSSLHPCLLFTNNILVYIPTLFTFPLFSLFIFIFPFTFYTVCQGSWPL